MKKGGFIIVSVIILISIGLLVITSSTYIFNMYLKNDEIHSIYSIATSNLNEQLRNFKNVLVYTNTDGDGYTTEGFDRRDSNNNDDDYNGSIHGLDGVIDDDGDAFKYRFGVVLPDNEENIFFLDDNYKDYAYINFVYLKKINVFVDRSCDYTIELYDGNIYKNDKAFVIKSSLKGVFDPGDNKVDIESLSPSPSDMIAIFIKNNTKDLLSYKLSGIAEDGQELERFTPYIDNGRNFDFYANVILKDKNKTYMTFGRIFHNILPQGKRPVAPTNFRIASSTGDTVTLEWQPNEFTVTGSYMLYEGIDTNVKCTDDYYYKSLPYGTNTYVGLFDTGSFYYTICASDIDFTGSNSLGSKGYLSTQSNIINVYR